MLKIIGKKYLRFNAENLFINQPFDKLRVLFDSFIKTVLIVYCKNWIAIYKKAF